MRNYHRWLDKILAFERKKRSSAMYLRALILISFFVGILTHQIWLSFAPEQTPNSSSGKRKLMQELELQAKTLASRNLALTIEQEANKNLQQMFSEQLVRQKALEKELAFYRDLMAPEKEVDGVTIYNAELKPGMLPQQKQLQLVLTQQKKRQSNIKVSVDADLIGVLDGQVKQYTLTELTQNKYNIDFKYFYILEAELDFPDNFELQRVTFNINVRANRGTKGGRLEQSYSVDELAPEDAHLTDIEKESRVILEQNSQVSDNPSQKTEVRGSND
ncbi:DUF6776 family protein [Shewanella gaetbuli]|uniref:Uncharacterized protein n=1 Tax=Shewanella gaetbuli TaxID=220752 RepID=A0A9X2CKS3_9GAMM|nr:DUF6776 family protein [Shewanella gaetbuli]MCL1141935.1 hypothetical protein [Shewanella gaetbuli]